MTAYADRIRTLREKSGKSTEEMCDLLGMSDMGYFDLELHDSELPTVLSLDQIRRLATALSVTVSALISEDGLAVPARRIEYRELVEHTKDHLRKAGRTQKQFEDEIGWDLNDFFESEQKTIDSYNLEFVKALCGALGILWLEAVP